MSIHYGGSGGGGGLFTFWAGLFEAGLRKPRVSAKFELRYESSLSIRRFWGKGER